jgi:DNA-binding response OmpR family regulator
VDLVVLDVNLAQENGWSVFEEMKELNPFVPTIVITAEFDQRGNAIGAGAEALIEKPMDVPAFLEIVQNLLDETSAKRLERVCGDDAYCRFVAGYLAPYLRRLDERHSAPLALSNSLKTALSIKTKIAIRGRHDLRMELAETA